jgi:TonB-dependent starch-binding outer membrane protein SusC
MKKKKSGCNSNKDVKPGLHILKQLYLSLLFLLIPVIAWSQEVTGTVTDAQNGEPLPGVHVMIVGTTTGTVTDIDGNYSITVPNLDRSLHFTFVGYEAVVVRLDGRTQVSVAMEMSAIMGQEVIVTGYGTVRQRETVSGSVSAVSGDRLERVPTANLSNTLAGRVSGLAGVNFSGEPGFDGSTIRIRGNATLGNNNPLIVIDGGAGKTGRTRKVKSS